MNKCILVLSTYPTKVPRHGGQVRVANIIRAYTDKGFNVTSISIYPEEGYNLDHVGVNDISFPISSNFRMEGAAGFLASDLAAGDYATKDSKAFQEVWGKIEANIAAIQIEQPWLLPLAEKLIAEHRLCRNSKIVYSSHNIESTLKENIFKQYDIRDSQFILDAILDLEKRAAQSAIFTSAVSEQDGRVLRSFGATDVVIAPNGVTPWSSDRSRVEFWKQKLPSVPWALFVASAHPPNVKGFLDCFGNSLACVPPTSAIVLAGSVGSHIVREMDRGPYASINRSRLMVLGELPDPDLDAVKTLAPIFVLPITEAGGTNLKTAEALYSGAAVLGTTVSFRGFEDFIGSPEIFVADDSKAFRRKLLEILSQAAVGSGRCRDSGMCTKLTWKHSLAPLVGRIGELLSQ